MTMTTRCVATAASAGGLSDAGSGAATEPASLGDIPKPFLTVVFGILYDIFHDWRVLVWATIGAYASGISVAALVARRVAGLGAAAFATIALIASSALLIDVSRGYAVAWALLGWAAAGLAGTAQRPRYDIAATALFL